MSYDFLMRLSKVRVYENMLAAYHERVISILKLKKILYLYYIGDEHG